MRRSSEETGPDGPSSSQLRWSHTYALAATQRTRDVVVHDVVPQWLSYTLEVGHKSREPKFMPDKLIDEPPLQQSTDCQ